MGQSLTRGYCFDSSKLAIPVAEMVFDDDAHDTDERLIARNKALFEKNLALSKNEASLFEKNRALSKNEASLKARISFLTKATIMHTDNETQAIARAETVEACLKNLRAENEEYCNTIYALDCHLAASTTRTGELEQQLITCHSV